MFMNVHHLYYLLFLPFHFFVLKQMWCKLGRENSFCFPSLIIKDSMRKLMSMLIFPLGGPRQKAGTHHLKKLLCILIWRHFVFSLILFRNFSVNFLSTMSWNFVLTTYFQQRKLSGISMIFGNIHCYLYVTSNS